MIAELEHATPDGAAAYTFRFAVEDDVVTTEVFTPAGQVPPVDDECALATFLRMAPDDAVVPMVLRRSCASYDIPTLPVTATVAELRPVGLAFQLGNATGPACTESAYNARYDALVTAASYVPKINVETGSACDAYYYLGANLTCTVYDAHTGELWGTCDVTQLPEDCPAGCFACHPVYMQEPDPDCEHNISSWGDYSPAWLDWQIKTPTSTVSALRFEVSACGSSDQTSAGWQSRRHTTDAWSTLHVTVWNGAGIYQKIFDSGTSSGNWSGNQFQFQAHSNHGLRPMYAGARMQGLDRSDCPSHLL